MKSNPFATRRNPHSLFNTLTLVMLPLLLATTQQSWAGSDTWTGASNGNWHTAGNWAGGNAPANAADIASFGTSATTDISIGQYTAIDGITFNAGADAFTISKAAPAAVSLGGQGIINNSGVKQRFELPESLYIENLFFFDFRGNATAGSKTTFALEGGKVEYGIGANIRFYDNASAAGGSFELYGGQGDLIMGARVLFFNSATAANGTFEMFGNQGRGNDLDSAAGTLIAFYENSTAGNAVFNLAAGMDALSKAAILSFEGNSSAENATINVHSLPFGAGENARVTFGANSTAGNSTLIASTVFGNDLPGFISFNGAATGGTATVWLRSTGQLRISGLSTDGVSIGSLEGDSVSEVRLGNKKLTVGTNNKSTIMRGVITGAGGSLEKTGTGLLTLSGSNTYTGTTSVTGGELRISGTVLGDTIVSTDAILSGTGTLAAVQVGAAAVIAPGPNKGTLRTGDLTLSPTAQIQFDLATPGTVGGGVNDLIAVEGDLTLDGTLTLSNLGDLTEGTYTLITYTGTLTDNELTLGNPADGFIYTVDSTQANTISLQIIRATAALELSTSELDFAVRPYNVASTARVLSIQNDGNVPVSVSSIIFTGIHGGEFIVVSETCSATPLAVAAQCSVTLNHNGSSVGGRTATLNIHSDADNSPNEVILNARVVAEPVLTGLNGTALEFQAGTGPLLIDADAQTALSLPGALNLAGATLHVEFTSGADAEDDLLSFSTAGDISLSTSSAGSDVSVNGVVIGTLDSDIAAGEVLGVTFNENATPVRVQLLLQAITYRNINTTNPAAGIREIRIELTFLGQLASATLTANVNVTQTLYLSAAELAFGIRAYNEAPTSRSLSIQNSGNIPVNLAESVLIGAHAADYVIATDTCSEATLSVGAQCDITLHHEGNTPGVRNATLRFASDAEGSPHEVNLIAQVVGEPVFENLGGSTSVFVTGALPLLLGADAQLSVPGAQDLTGAGLLVQLLAGADAEEDMLAIDSENRVTLTGFEAGDDVLVDGLIIGILGNTLAPGEDLLVIFNEDATPAHVQILLQNLTFQNLNGTDPVNGVRDISVTLTYLGMVASVDVAIDVQTPPPPSTDGNITAEVVGQTLNGAVQIGSGGVINGGTINGNVTGNGVVTGDVVMGAGATISGAKITGNLNGNAAAPARLSGGTVTSAAKLSNVIIGPDVLLEPGLTLGEGVTFESPGLIDAVQSIEVFDTGGATVTQQSTGQITVKGDGYQAVTMPVEIVQAQIGQEPGVYYGEDGDILLITEDGLGIRAYPLPADSASLQSMMTDRSLQITFSPLGQMLVSPSETSDDALQSDRIVMALQIEQTYFIARPDVLAIPAWRGNTLGLLEYPVSGLGTVQHMSSLFVASDGSVMQQDLVPTPVDWQMLKTTLLNLPGVTAASLDTRGTIQVSIDGVTLRGVMDYTVTRGGQGNVEGLALDLVGDLSGNGMDDYRVTYANGDQQLLFVYQLE